MGDIFRLIPTMWEDGMESCSGLSLHFAAHNLYVGEVSILHIFQPVSPILLLSLAFMFFPHRWVERAPGGVMVKKHMKEVKAVDKQDLEMTDHEPMPPAFCICCKAR